MSSSIFQKIVEQMKEFDDPINVVQIYGLGEPMLNAQLPEFIQTLKREKVAKEVAVTSNGSRLDPEYSRRLIEAGLNRLTISLNGIEDRHYKELTGSNVRFDELYKKIQYFYQIRKQCHLHIKIIGDYFTEEEQQKFVELFSAFCDTLNIDHAVNIWADMEVTENRGKPCMVLPHRRETSFVQKCFIHYWSIPTAA